jgi:hypothetical protein
MLMKLRSSLTGREAEFFSVAPKWNSLEHGSVFPFGFASGISVETGPHEFLIFLCLFLPQPLSAHLISTVA